MIGIRKPCETCGHTEFRKLARTATMSLYFVCSSCGKHNIYLKKTETVKKRMNVFQKIWRKFKRGE